MASRIMDFAASELSPSYADLLQKARSLLSGQTHAIANAANLSALIFQELPDLNWAGFYFLEDDTLVVGPFQGKPACVHIALGKGVCGTAAVTRQTQRVADVHAFEGHIACDGRSQSEIVVPLHDASGNIVGVLDVDSSELDSFDATDAFWLEKTVKLVYGNPQ